MARAGKSWCLQSHGKAEQCSLLLGFGFCQTEKPFYYMGETKHETNKSREGQRPENVWEFLQSESLVLFEGGKADLLLRCE